MPRLVITLVSLLGLACQAPHYVGAAVQEVRGAVDENGHAYAGVDVLLTDPTGRAIPCGMGNLELEVAVKRDRGGWMPVPDVRPACAAMNDASFALVMDNSGSQGPFLGTLKSAARQIVDTVIPAGGRGSFVRVSTDARVTQRMTTSQADLHRAVDGMFVNRGWTALYDGIRMGNETLASSMMTPPMDAADRLSFCTRAPRRGVIVFTDGRENNSSNERLRSADYPGDGIDTTLEDLYDLSIDGVATPIYTVGLGRNVDHAALRSLANETGGVHAVVETDRDLERALGQIGDYFGSGHRTCFELPVTGCGDVDVRVKYRWRHAGEVHNGQRVVRLNLRCTN